MSPCLRSRLLSFIRKSSPFGQHSLNRPRATMATSCLLQLRGHKASEPVTLQAYCKVQEARSFQQKPLYQVLDISVTNYTSAHVNGVAEIHASDLPECSSTSYLLEKVQQYQQARQALSFKFILPLRNGFCIRSDFLEHRLDGCQTASEVRSFLEPRQAVSACSSLPEGVLCEAATLCKALPYAVGAVIATDASTMEQLELDLSYRVSYPWLADFPIPQKRIAWVKAKQDLEASERIWQAAQALGISVVIIDHPGHWFQVENAPYSHLREAFIPTDITVNETFVDRIVSAVKGYGKPIDAVMTVSNERMIGVARVNEILGLPTASSAAHTIAANKYTTREVEPDNGGAFRVHSVDELRARLNSSEHPPLEYPMIVKPCMGWGSECVSKAENETELIAAVDRAAARHRLGAHKRSDVMLEPYIDGPEVDANVVLLDGRILFMEVGDDFPSAGDAVGADWQATFQETRMVFPTVLPDAEIAVIRDSLAESLRREGFTYGVFHCEGRVRHSSMAYSTIDGVIDLRPAPRKATKQPSFYLHEVNARPPGYLESVAMHLTYGVDYYAVQLLFAVGHFELGAALSHPFQTGAQWSLALGVLPETKEGIMKNEDPAKELLERVPRLKAATVDCKAMAKKGARLAGLNSSHLNYVAYFSVVSRKSRAEALELEDLLQKEFTYDVE